MKGGSPHRSIAWRRLGAELEKTNGRMLLGLRKLLTPEQWIKLNQAFTLSLTQK